MLLLVVCFQLSAENILGNVTADDVTGSQVHRDTPPSRPPVQPGRLVYFDI